MSSSRPGWDEIVMIHRTKSQALDWSFGISKECLMITALNVVACFIRITYIGKWDHDERMP